jgi:response regulator RpfG family c-di-GMP phosphodiesterase
MNEPTTAPVRILCVDDEPSILSALKRVFRPLGYIVLTATSGREGLALLENEPVDLVISDMRMPEMDGAQFLEQVFARAPATKRILLTGYADAAATIAAINQGKIWRYVAKPWHDSELILTVQQALAHRNLMAENARLTRLTQAQNEELLELNAGLEQKVAERTAQLRATLASLEQAHGDLKRNFLNSVRVFSGLVELRGGELGSQFVGHGRRVADMARAVAQRLGLAETEIQNAMLAGLLHDIGKIGLPDPLLAKPFIGLTGPERARVMTHPTVGENLLMAIDQLKESALAIRHHHEYFDGSGYPDRLAGENIPLIARILAVVNDFDALQLGTLTRRRYSSAEALAFLIDQNGIRYDPQIVKIFAHWLLANQPTLRGKIQLPPGEDWSSLEVEPGEPVVPSIEIRPGKLEPGMVLARDLIHRDGYMLLAAGFVLGPTTIDRLRRIQIEEGKDFTLTIRQES